MTDDHQSQPPRLSAGPRSARRGHLFRVAEDVLQDWEYRIGDSTELYQHRAAYAQFRRDRYSDRITSDFDETRNWPGAWYIALDTLSRPGVPP